MNREQIRKASLPSGRIFYFEMDKTLPNHFVSAKKQMIDDYLRGEGFPERLFHEEFVTHCTEEEKEDFIQLADHSKYLI